MNDDELMRRYLRRLGVQEILAADRDTLQRLMAAHLEAIPFENLDVLAGSRSPLSSESVLHKVAVRGRGGFCYELNEAFRMLLAWLGFAVRRVEARVWVAPQRQFGPPFDHLALLVDLPEGEFLVDVGFGDNNRSPMRLPEDSLSDVSGRYTLSRSSQGLWLLARQDRLLYELTLEPRELAEFDGMYRFHQSSPESIFSKGLICTRATPTGRITLSDTTLTITEGSRRAESVVTDHDQALQHYFGIPGEEPTC